MAEGAAERARRHVDVPWDELRAARVHRRALERFRLDDLPDEDEPAAAPPRRWLVWLAAGTVLALALGSWGIWRGEAPTSSLRYRDGSRSVLHADAQLRVLHEAADAVLVEQLTGTVQYDIVPQPERRFEVRVGGVAVQVLGTVFVVEADGALVHVRVERGRVRVSHAAGVTMLGADESVTVRADAATTASGSPNEPAAAPPPAVSGAAATPAATAAERAPTPPSSAEAKEPRRPKSPPAPEASAAPPTSGAAELLARADEARSAGRLAEAADLLRALLVAYPGDRRTAVAQLTLGRVEVQRGRHEAAAVAFEGCAGLFHGDALAEAAAAWAAAGQAARSAELAARYLSRYPEGVHAARMRPLAGR